MSSQPSTISLDELVTLQTDKVFANKNPDLPYVGLEHIEQGRPRLLGWLPSTASVSTNCVFSKDDILFGKLRPNLRKSVRAPFEGYCSTDILVLRARDGISPAFAAHVLQWENVFNAAAATAAGTKMPRTSWNELKRFRVFCPESITQQDFIALVLDELEATIANAAAVLAKLKQVRVGLLHTLLTRGLGENGEPRDPIMHPEHFAESPAGLIPREWTLKSVRECLTGDPQNGVYKPPSKIGQGTLLIGQTGINNERMVTADHARRAAITTEELNRHGLVPGDILLSRVFATIAGVGLPAFVNSLPEPAVYESNMMRLRVDSTVVSPPLLFELLRTTGVRTKLIAAAHLSNQASINQPALNRTPIAVPPVEEQEAIVALIRTQDNAVNSIEGELEKWKRLKLGLAADLLPGRIRVPNSLEG